MKLLILGGTAFLGPEIVRHAQKQGHTVTLFNRGKTRKDLFPDVERIVGDRDKDEYGGLEGRTWDAAIDTSANTASWMRKSTEALKGKVGQYVFTSSISVYPMNSFQKPGKDETAEVLPWPEGTDEKTKDMQLYGNTKARCEAIMMEAFGNRGTVIRPGLIVGAGDYSDRFTYWPVRIDKGGEILAPGTPNDFTQFIDARDLGEWCVKVCEDGHHGIYNATGPLKPLPMAGLLYGCKAVVSNDATFTWVPEAFLEEQKVGAWMEMPVWVGSSPEMAGFSQVSIDKAVQHGLKFRPLADTVKVTLDWAKNERPKERKWRAGIVPEKEQAVLKAWHEKEGTSPTTGPTTKP